MRSLRTAALAAVTVLALVTPAHAGDEGPEGDDHVVISGGFKLGPDELAGDIVVIEGDVVLAGRVTGDVVAVEGDVRIPTGLVEGDVATVAGKTIMGPRTRVSGDLVYSDEKPEVPASAVVGGEIREEDWSEIGDAPWTLIGAAALWIAVSVSLLVLGVALVAIFPRAAEAAFAAADSQIWLSVAMGLAAVIGLPIVIGLAFVTLVGIPLAIVIGLAVVPLWALGYVTCCYVLGRKVVNEGPHPILAFLAGLGILRALALIPIVGALAWIPAVVVGLGALIVAVMPNGKTAAASG